MACSANAAPTDGVARPANGAGAQLPVQRGARALRRAGRHARERVRSVRARRAHGVAGRATRGRRGRARARRPRRRRVHSGQAPVVVRRRRRRRRRGRVAIAHGRRRRRRRRARIRVRAGGRARRAGAATQRVRQGRVPLAQRVEAVRVVRGPRCGRGFGLCRAPTNCARARSDGVDERAQRALGGAVWHRHVLLFRLVGAEIVSLGACRRRGARRALNRPDRRPSS